MFEKVNPAHPDKVADRIAGAVVDIAYETQIDPKVAVEVLIGHGICHIVAETSANLNEKKVIAADVYEATWNWLAERRCTALVSPQLLERYAMSVARWIQCEEAITEYGFLAKHPTTGNAIQSPYVAMSQNFMSQTNRLWMEIFQIVKENCSSEYSGATPQDDVMERLLQARTGGKQ